MNEYSYQIGEGPFFTVYYKDMIKDANYGFLQADYFKTESTESIYKMKDKLNKKFELEYSYREISQETPDRWMDRLNNKIMEINDKYNRAFELYETNMLEYGYDISDGGYLYEDSGNNKGTASNVNTASSTNTNKFKDTPYGSEGDVNYITEQTENSDSSNANTTSNTSSSFDSSRKRKDFSKQKLRLMNDNIDEYRNLINDYIAEFKPLFLYVYGGALNW